MWRCEKGCTRTIGSFAELEELSGVKLTDPHRPFVDEVTFPCENCGGPMTRVPEVIDVWFDSGSMPFAQFHAPHENTEHFEQRFPADFICEALDQTRGWFYSLLAISTLLYDQSSYRNVVCLGLILDEQGRKMSKSVGNTVEPWEIIDRYGADALRWYFFTSKLPWDGYRFSLETIGEAVRQFLLQLWNTYGFYVLYANAGDVAAGARSRPRPRPTSTAGSSPACTGTTEIVRDRLDDFDATTAGRAIQAFVDELSNWYVRRSRRRFWDADPAAFATLRECLVTVAKLTAPFTPFIADEIYDNLDGAEPSVHLCDFPGSPGHPARPRPRVRDGDRPRHGPPRPRARGQSKLKVRQPLRAAVVVAAGREREAIERLDEIVREELNVHELRFVSDADELGEVEIKPNYRSLGPRFGKQMPLVAAAVAGLDAAHVASALRDGQSISISVAGSDHALDGRRPARHDEAAGRLPGRARGLACGGARPRARRRAAGRGLGARHRAGGPERPPGGRL